MHGFVLHQHIERFSTITAQLYEWVRRGQLQAHEDLAHGLDAAPSALMRLFQGLNVGKQLVVLEGADELEPNLTVPRSR